MGTGATVPLAYRFAGFRVDLGRRRVLGQDGEVLQVSSRAYDVLVHLIEHRAHVVGKDDLLRAVWPNLVVEENNLGQAISMLRRAFCDPRETSAVISTVQGRGYRFVANVDVEFVVEHLASSDSDVEGLADAHGEPSAALLEKPSLAALPFANHSDDPEQDYFVDGMTQEVITALSRIRSLFVISSSATMSMKGRVRDPQTAARRFGVRYILEGSVRRAGSKVRIAVGLTDARSGAQIWADRFEDTLQDVFALQDRVALSVAAAVEPNIAAAELRRVARSPVEDLGCYDLYLRASHLRATLRKPEVIQAIALLDKALALNPEYAPALAQAAGCHSQVYVNRWTDDFEAHRQQGLIMAERAERAAGEDASVLTHIANALMDLDHIQSHNIDRALGLIERAVAINPGSAYAWFISGVLKLVDGNGDAAVEHLQRTVRLDPVSPLSEAARAHIGVGRVLQGAYEEALHIFRATTFRTPRIQLVLVCTCVQLGRLTEAREALRHYQQLSTVPAETMLAHSSRHAPLQAWFSEMIIRAGDSPHNEFV